MSKVLIVVDFQNDFVNGSLGFEGADLLEDLIFNKVRECRSDKYDVIFTLDTHCDNYLDTLEGENIPIKHCIKGTNGHKLYGKLECEVLSVDKVFEKDTFPSLKMAKYLETTSYEEVELCGLVSNICVLSNVVMVRSALPNCKIVVDYNLTKSFDLELNDKTFDILKGLGVEVRNYD